MQRVPRILDDSDGDVGQDDAENLCSFLVNGQLLKERLFYSLVALVSCKLL